MPQACASIEMIREWLGLVVPLICPPLWSTLSLQALDVSHASSGALWSANFGDDVL